MIGEDPVLKTSGAGDAWFISELAYPSMAQRSGVTYVPRYSSFFDYGKGECFPSVAINGKCYYTHAVNYAMWGKIMHLAQQFMSQFGEGNKYSLDAAEGGTIYHKVHDLGEAVSSFNTQEALAFTRYGYDGRDPSAFAIPNAYVDPKNVSAIRLEPFEWVWLPGKPESTAPKFIVQ